MRDAAALDDATRAALADLSIRGLHRGAPGAGHQRLVDAGLAMVKGPLVMLTAAGREEAERITRLPAGGADEAALRPLFDAFLPINRELREVCTAWQLRLDGRPNDHADAAYDAGVRDRLDDVDEAVGRVLRRMTAVRGELGHYREELAAALERLDSGDASALASPLSPSYHTVWMWLHQELLLLLGISRAEDAQRETELVEGRRT